MTNWLDICAYMARVMVAVACFAIAIRERKDPAKWILLLGMSMLLVEAK